MSKWNIMWRSKKYRFLFCLILGIGFLGLIFFFPVQINSRYTCLYHRLFQPDHNYNAGGKRISPNYTGTFKRDWNRGFNGSDHSKPGMMNDRIKENDLKSQNTINEMHSSELLDRYIHGYAWFWWGSILLLVSAFYLMRNRNLSIKKN